MYGYSSLPPSILVCGSVVFFFFLIIQSDFNVQPELRKMVPKDV